MDINSIDWAGHRVTRYTVTRLSRLEHEIGELKEVLSGSVSVSATTQLRTSASLEIADTGQGINFASERVRIDATVNGYTWPLGVFLYSSPKRSYTDAQTTISVELLGKLAILSESCTQYPYSVPANTAVVPLVKSLIEAQGETNIIATDKQKSLRSAMVWDAGTSYLKIINDLLDAINYWGLYTDGSGAFCITPYTLPEDRGISWMFVEGANCIHTAEWTREQDILGVPNQVVLVGNAAGGGGDNEDKHVLTGIARNENPDSPYSYQSRGRWITHTETGIEADSTGTLFAKAQRKLQELSAPVGKIDIKNAPLALDPNQVVLFDSQGHRAKATIQEIKYTLDPTALADTTLKEIEVITMPTDLSTLVETLAELSAKVDAAMQLRWGVLDSVEPATVTLDGGGVLSDGVEILGTAIEGDRVAVTIVNRRAIVLGGVRQKLPNGGLTVQSGWTLYYVRVERNGAMIHADFRLTGSQQSFSSGQIMTVAKLNPLISIKGDGTAVGFIEKVGNFSLRVVRDNLQVVAGSGGGKFPPGDYYASITWNI